MREEINNILLEHGLRRGNGFECLADAVERYGDQTLSLKRIYAEIADRRGMSFSAVEKAVSSCVNSSEYDMQITPKAFIAQIKERIMFEIDE